MNETIVKVIQFESNEVITVDKYLEPILILTIQECKAFINCPFSNNYASDKNYPGYNAVISKIHDFARK